MPRPAPPAPPAPAARRAPRPAPPPAPRRPPLLPPHTPAPLPGSWASGGGAPRPASRGGSGPSSVELDALWLNTDLLGARERRRLPTAEEFAALHTHAAAPAAAR